MSAHEVFPAPVHSKYLHAPRSCEVKVCRARFVPRAPNQTRCTQCVAQRRFNPRPKRAA